MQRRELVLCELVLVGKRRELLLVDEAALGGLLEQALGGREVVQVYRVAQFNPFLSLGSAARSGGLAVRARGFAAMSRSASL